jgi:glutamate 5-kinase
VSVKGDFAIEDAVEIAGLDGAVFAKGLARHPASRADEWLGQRSRDLPADLDPEVVHRDDLVVLSAG